MEGVDQLATTLLSLLSGGLAVHIVDRIKRDYGLEGNNAFLLSAAVALVMAVLSVVADGALSADGVSAENAATYLTAVIVAMERYYQFVRSRQGNDDS